MKTIVSLTTFPAAVEYSAKAVGSILRGSVLPDLVVLYLAEPQFPDRVVPAALEALTTDPLFEVRWWPEDIRSYKKLVPALTEFPDAVIVTVDDDADYHRHLLRDLLRWHAKAPDAIFAHRAKRIVPDAPYRKWRKYRWYRFLFKKLHFDVRNIQTGVGGVLYPPRALDARMIDPEQFMKIAPTQDDIWFWAAATAKGTPIVPVPMGRNKPRGVGKPKELTLKSVNFKSGEDRNRAAFERILAAYPEIGERVRG